MDVAVVQNVDVTGGLVKGPNDEALKVVRMFGHTGVEPDTQQVAPHPEWFLTVDAARSVRQQISALPDLFGGVDELPGDMRIEVTHGDQAELLGRIAEVRDAILEWFGEGHPFYEAWLADTVEDPAAVPDMVRSFLEWATERGLRARSDDAG